MKRRAPLAYHAVEGPEAVNEDFKVTCPCCQSKILIHHKTGAVLSHEPPPGRATPTFEQAVAANARRKDEAEDIFAQAVREHENKEEILEKKFKEAFEKADKDGSPPPHPFEYE